MERKAKKIFWSKKNSGFPTKKTCVYGEKGDPLYWKIIIDEVCFVCFHQKLTERLEKAIESVIAIKELRGEVKIKPGGTYLVLKKVILEEKEDDNVNNFSN